MNMTTIQLPHGATLVGAYDYDAEADISRVLLPVKRKPRRGTYSLSGDTLQVPAEHAEGLFVLVQLADGGIDLKIV